MKKKKTNRPLLRINVRRRPAKREVARRRT